MKACGVAFLVELAVLQFAGALCGDEVEVIAPKAQVKVGDRVIAEADQGRRLRLLKTKGPWVAVIVGEGERAERGWVLANKVRRVVDPDLQNAPAPETPVDFRLEADWTQLRAAPDGKSHYLFLLAKLTNETVETVQAGAEEIRLRVDEQIFSPIQPGAQSTDAGISNVNPQGNTPRFALPPAYRPPAARRTPRDGFPGFPGFPSRGFRRGENSAAPQGPERITPETNNPYRGVSFLQNTALQPGATTEGWLCFDLAPLAGALNKPLGLGEKDWVLETNLAGQRLKVDLKDQSLSRLGAKLRASKFDSSVPVVEFAAHVNALNVGKLVETLDAASKGEMPCLLVFKSDEWFVEDFSAAQLQARQSRGRATLLPITPPSSLRHEMLLYFQTRGSAISEEVGTVQILAQNGDEAIPLYKFLSSQAVETRVAAALSLITFIKQPGVAERLSDAATDRATEVREAAFLALGARLQNQPVKVWPEQSGPGAAILKGLRDAEAPVRRAAAWAAGCAASQIVEKELIAALDDEVLEVRQTACGSLGLLKSKAAVGKLQQLRASDQLGLKLPAIGALEGIGELTALEAAMERLQSGSPNTSDFETIVVAKELRAVPKLLELIKGLGSRHAGLAAKALGELEAKEAVGPLINALRESGPGFRSGSEEIALALGRLGDPAAIEPIRNAMQRQGFPFNGQLRYFEALIMLNAPGIRDELATALKEPTAQGDVGPALELLARYGDERTIPVIERYLDQELHCQSAARALVLIRSPRNRWLAALIPPITNLARKCSMQSILRILLGSKAHLAFHCFNRRQRARIRRRRSERSRFLRQ